MKEGASSRPRPVSGLARLWASTPQARSPRVGLSAERIVAAAIEIADEEGLESVSMSRVADRLGFTTMAVYRHIAGKDDLLLLMHDTAWRPPAVRNDGPDGAGDGWRKQLSRWCHEQYEILRRHPWLERIRHSERAGTPSQMEWLERGLCALAGTGLSERVKLHLLLLLNGYVFWEARTAADAAAAARAEGFPPEQATARFDARLREFADAERFPALMRALDEGGIDQADGERAAAFAFGLEFLLDGIDRLLATDV